jgi:DNA mismatch repair protein MLH1
VGTIICVAHDPSLLTLKVEDMFYNSPARRNAMRSASEEYAKMVDVVSRYALHYHKVSFAIKKVSACWCL